MRAQLCSLLVVLRNGRVTVAKGEMSYLSFTLDLTKYEIVVCEGLAFVCKREKS
jgi:hypothetical protein